MAAPDVTPPPLEELRAEAARRGTEEQRRGLSRMNRWAWAASVVLALGTGWMLRGSIGGWLSQPGPPQAAEPSVAQPAASDVAVDSAPGEAASHEAEARDQGAAASVVEATAEESTAEEGADEVPAEEAGAGAAGIDETEADRAASGAPPADEVASRGRGGLAPATMPETQDAAPGTKADSLALPPPPEASAETLSAQARLESAPAAAEFVGALRRARTGPPADAERPTQAELLEVQGQAFVPVVPDLEVLDMQSIRIPDVGGGTQVRQVTASGDVLVLIHFPDGVEPSAVRLPAAADEEEVIVQRDDGWTLLRGPFTEEQLLAFGSQMRAGG
jgi:hypothetical protein